MFHCRNLSLARDLCEIRHLVLVWEGNLIISRRIRGLVHNSYLRVPINLLINCWLLLRRSHACCIHHHCKLLWHMHHRLPSRLHLLCLLGHPIGCLLSCHRLWSGWTSRLLISRFHVWYADTSYLSSCLIMENPVDSLLMRRLRNQYF